MIVTEKDLRFLFASYGELENNDGIILFRKDIPGYTNYAHVNFQKRDDAAAAKSALNQSEFFGRYLRVEWNRSPKKFTEAAISLNSNMSSPIATAVQVTGHTTNVLIPTTGHIMAPTNDRGTYVCCPVLSIYVQFETVQEGARVSEATIRNIFEPFGGVTGINTFFYIEILLTLICP